MSRSPLRAAAETDRGAQPGWLERLSHFEGTLRDGADLARVTWFRVGGAADLLARPSSPEELSALMAAVPADVAVLPLGVGSNLLVRDGGLDGVVVRLGRPFIQLSMDGDGVLTAGGGALDLSVAQAAAQAGRTGLEFLSGIPGTIGGAVRMNAGAYGREVKDALVDATVIDRSGHVQVLDAARLGLTYRHSDLPDDSVVISARFRTEPGDREAIIARMGEIRSAREDSQPIRARTGGSTFANPEGHKAWRLIDAAGCRGLVIGDAQVSEKHCNFLINRGSATADDLERLGETVRLRVFQDSGVRLRWEIKRIGRPAKGAAPIRRLEDVA